MSVANHSYDHESMLIDCLCGNLNEIRIIPQGLSLMKVDSMLCLVPLTLVRVKFEFHGMQIIP